ncbi:hypothetical protein Scep_029101 [Stephania cephalantha]|uniref:Uncharacterized protein n=1 Tax=Stephania cephalantha TaxID=152367 RepID=A0AAP0DWY9_9MAGN
MEGHDGSTSQAQETIVSNCFQWDTALLVLPHCVPLSLPSHMILPRVIHPPHHFLSLSSL